MSTTFSEDDVGSIALYESDAQYEVERLRAVLRAAAKRQVWIGRSLVLGRMSYES